MKYTLRQLEVFIAVAQLESVTKAAEALAMTQSAASMALTELEKQFDTKLFDRIGKRLQLNELGRQLLPRTMELLDRAREIETLLTGKSDVGPWHIGATLTIGNYLAPLLIGEFMRIHPTCRVQLAVANTESIVEQVAHFKLDFGLIEGHCVHPELEVLPWIADELVIFCAPDHPLAHKAKTRANVTLDDVLQQPWIMRESGSGTRETFDFAMRHALSRLNIRLELGHTEAIKRAVESGMGIGCISRLALKDAFKRGSLVALEIPELDFRRQFQFVLHKNKFRTSGINEFLALCRRVAEGVERSDEISLQSEMLT